MVFTQKEFMSESIKKISVQIEKEKYEYFLSFFETEQDAINYLELNIDNISRKHYKKKEDVVTLELNLLAALEPKLDSFLAKKNITLKILVNKLIKKAIR